MARYSFSPPGRLRISLSRLTRVETAKINDLDPQAYLADILDRIHNHKINRLGKLLPWNWAPMAQEIDSQAA